MSCLIALPAIAEEVIEDANKESEEITPPTYTECFKFVQEHLLSKVEQLNQQAKKRDLPVNVERDEFDIHALNPRINPTADDVKASLEIDLPKNKKEEASNDLSYQCNTLYGIKN